MILPKFIGKWLTILRGGVSPVFIFVSVMLGFWFGLMPGWSGLHTLLVIVVLLFNIHIGLFLLSAGIGKTVCFAAAPVLYHVGVGIQNYLAFLLRLLASLPIVGITDFSRYSLAGALVVGPVVGAIAGLLMARSVIGFRRMLLKLEEGSDKFKKWYSNRWVRILDRLLVGRRTKDVKSLFTAKTKVFRKAGIALALILLVGSAVVTTVIKDNTIRDYATSKMTQANGAEVNLEDLNLSALTGAISASGIQVTDPENPRNNQLSVDKVASDISVYNLLLGKVVMEQVEVSNIQFNQERSTPGQVIEPESDQEPGVFDPCEFKLGPADVAKLEKYLKDAKALKEKLQKLRRWLPKAKDKDEDAQPDQAPQKYLEYLQARAIVPAAPRIMAKRAVLDDVHLESPVFGNSRILLANVSDAPRAAKLPVTFEMTSKDTSAALSVTVDYSSKDQIPKLSGRFDSIDMAKTQSGISDDAGLVFQSGIASGQFSGIATSEHVDLTVDIIIRDLQAKGGGKGILGLGSDTTSQVFDSLKELKTTVRIVGPIADPRLAFDVGGLTDQFKKALVEAGKDRLIKEIDNRLGKQLDEKLGDKVPGEIKDVLKKPEKLLNGLGGLLGGKRDEEEEK